MEPASNTVQTEKPRVSSRRLFRSVSYGIVAFIAAFSLGTVVTVTTGIPLAGGLLNGVITAAILTVGMLHNRYFGNATLIWFAFSIPAIVTTTLGPPGIYKIAIALIAGLIWDLVYVGSRYKSWGLYIGGLAGSISIMLTLILFLSLGFTEQAAEALDRYQSFLVPLLVINTVVTAVGIWLGKRLFDNRLSKLDAFRKSTGSNDETDD